MMKDSLKQRQNAGKAVLRRWLPLILILFLLVTSSGQTQAVAAAPSGALADRWFDMGLNAQLVDWFNDHARPTDIARVDHYRLANLLDDVTVGQKLVVFKSVAEIETLMPTLAGKLDIIGYNLEHGQANRPDEINDPIGSVQKARQLADRYGKRLAFGPDHQFAVNNGVAMAPYVDLFVLQVQRVQTEPQTVRDFVLPLARSLRKANPKIEISVQVRTEGDVTALVSMLNSMKDELDGISILTSPETVPVAQKLGTALRDTKAVIAPLSTPATIATPAGEAAEDSSGFCGGAFLPWMAIGGLLLIVKRK